MYKIFSGTKCALFNNEPYHTLKLRHLGESKMNTFFSKSKIQSGVALALLGGAFLAAGTAQAAVIDFTFNTANIAGSTTARSFTADEMTITSVGLSSFTFTDTSAPAGLIGAADDFVEIGIVSAVNFQNNNINIPVGTTHINFSYELLASFTISGTASLTPAGNVVVNILPGASVATIYYDEILNSAIDGSTIIGQLTAGAGDCVITAGTAFTEASCKMTFDFDAAGISDSGVWTYMGADVGSYNGARMTLDINGNNITTPGSTLPFFPASGVITGSLDHDGSAVLSVPEPGTIAIMGLGLLGLAGFARRRRGA